MRKEFVSLFSPNSLLLLGLILMVFITPMVPVRYHDLAYNFLFSCVFLSAALSLQHIRKKIIIAVALLLIVIIWFAEKVDLPGLATMSRACQGLFFIFIVVRLIRQTARAKNVNLGVIADSINGYLLVGVIYSLIVYSLVRIQPDAYHFPEGNDEAGQVVMSKMFYYTFVTYTSTGYGDIIPKIPGARSLATLISTTGQLYVAIIIAMLVGKFSSTGAVN
ncbi:MAG TPA: potassium channel family protein [Chryseolinea sp.]